MTRLCGGKRSPSVFPRVRSQLANAQRNALFFAVELQHLDGDLVARMQHFGRMIDAPMRHVADVQQAVDAAQIDERAVFGEVLHRARDHGAFGEMFQRRAACAISASPRRAVLRETTTLPRRRLSFRILTGISWPTN